MVPRQGFLSSPMSQPETMSDILPAPEIVLHIWPGRWDLPSFDPLCLATVLYLQLAIPGKFRLVECSNSDSSPTGVLNHCLPPYYKSFTLHRTLGQLPFLLHDQFSVSSFTSIVKYISRIKDANPDLDLSLTERAQRTAWYAHVESRLGDLVVYHSPFFSKTSLTNPLVL